MWAVLEWVWIVGMGWFVATQVLLPIAFGRPLLPLMRPQAQLEHRLKVQRQREYEESLTRKLERGHGHAKR